MNESIHVRHLCKKYLTGSITSEELQQFLVYLHDNNGHDILREEMLTLLKAGKYSQVSAEVHSDSAVQEILDIVHKEGRQQRSTALSVYRTLFHSPWRWAAAAGILMLFSIGVYQWTGISTKQDRTAVLASKTDDNHIKPGSNKAILTLANGAQVVLDSLQEGEVVRQGNTKFMKVSGGQIAYQSPGNPSGRNMVQYNTLSTPKGGQFQLTLPDGTKVWLNAASSIHYPTRFANGVRTVEITGEVYFEVARNTDMPFVVKHGAVKVQVLGTHFNVNAYEDEDDLKVTLLEGSVKVLDTVKQMSKILQPGQQARLDHTGQIRLDRNADVEAAVAWKNGLFQFNGTGIQEVMEQIARWYNVDVAYSGTIAQQFYGKIPRTATISEVLKMLEMTEGVKFIVQGSKIIAMPYK